METSTEVSNIFKAYALCAPKLANIAKDSKAYNYNYTSLEKLIEHTKPILAEDNLAIIQMPTGNGLTTRLIHNSGEWIEQEMTSELIQMKQMNAFQVQGSQITYLRRYMWASLCGIASDDDMDASEPNHVPEVKKEVVSPQALKKINTLISLKGADIEQLKSHYKVESLKDLPLNAVQGLIEYLEKL